jgi:DNA-binding MarR family transcriptional regulator
MNTAFQPSGNEVKHAAFQEHRRSGRMKSSQGAVIAALVFADCIAMTRNELAEVTGLPLSSICGRCRELLDLGNIEVAGMTADKPARQKLQLTEKGRALALAAAEGVAS